MTETEKSASEAREATDKAAQAADPREAPAGAEGQAADAGPAEPDPKAEAARLKDQLLRTAADFENFRKRSRREAEDALRRGRETLLKELLPVFDNLERAAQSAEGATDAKSVAEGLRIVMKQFGDTLDRSGIRRLPAVGRPFDPSVHEAIQQIESNEPAGVVVSEVQAGYAMGDHLVRASLVVVSKGPRESPSEGGAEGAH